MRNIKLEIEYDGTDFCGWQIQNSRQSPSGRLRSAPLSPVTSRQSKRISIQEVLEKTLKKILQEKVKVIGSGRTDAGVHAIAQVANFKTRSNIPLENLKRALNSLLPKSIAIKKASQVEDDFHSCYSARSKVYRYYLLNRKFRSVFYSKFYWHIPYSLNITLMKNESRVLLGRHDFRSFSTSNSGAKTSIRTVRAILVRKIGSIIIIDVEADGFLYNMVRNIVGTLIEIGRGKLKRGELKKIILAKDRRLAGPCAPAWGLFLLKVKY